MLKGGIEPPTNLHVFYNNGKDVIQSTAIDVTVGGVVIPHLLAIKLFLRLELFKTYSSV